LHRSAYHPLFTELPGRGEPVEKVAQVLACGLRFGPKDAISWPLESVFAPINVPALVFQQPRIL
jgi:hypothetical protein